MCQNATNIYIFVQKHLQAAEEYLKQEGGNAALKKDIHNLRRSYPEINFNSEQNNEIVLGNRSKLDDYESFVALLGTELKIIP